MNLVNPKGTIMYYFLIEGIVFLEHRDGVPMIRALVYITTHWTRSMVNYNIRLSSFHNSKSCYIA